MDLIQLVKSFVTTWFNEHLHGLFLVFSYQANNIFGSRFVLHQCTTPFDIFKHVKYHNNKKAKAIHRNGYKTQYQNRRKMQKYLTLTRKHMTTHFHELQDSIVWCSRRTLNGN
jgi:hypothetical protein